MCTKSCVRTALLILAIVGGVLSVIMWSVFMSNKEGCNSPSMRNKSCKAWSAGAIALTALMATMAALAAAVASFGLTLAFCILWPTVTSIYVILLKVYLETEREVGDPLLFPAWVLAIIYACKLLGSCTCCACCDDEPEVVYVEKDELLKGAGHGERKQVPLDDKKDAQQGSQQTV